MLGIGKEIKLLNRDYTNKGNSFCYKAVKATQWNKDTLLNKCHNNWSSIRKTMKININLISY